MNKNDELQVNIEGYTSDGYGVAKPDGYVLFIPDTLKGETVLAHVVKVGKSFGYAKCVEIIKKSEHRAVPKCECARACGGCELWHFDREEEVFFKQEKVKSNFKKAGIEIPTPPVIYLDEEGYRNKAQYPVRLQNGRAVCGFYRHGSHDVIEGECKIQPTVFEEISKAVLKMNIPPYDEKTGKGTLRHIYLRANGDFSQIMLCLVVNGDFEPKKYDFSQLSVQFPSIYTVCINHNNENTNVIMGKKTEILSGDGYITDVLCGKKFEISPQSFYQVNHGACEKLYEKVREYASPTGERVLDLYCGIGTIGICACYDASELCGVEIVPEAIENAKRNASLNGINATFKVGKAEDIKTLVGGKFDVIIVDPPRKGCDGKTLDFLAEQAPKRIVYVSCDSATLARDCEILARHGYTVQDITLVNMFPKTKHIESVALLRKICF